MLTELGDRWDLGITAEGRAEANYGNRHKDILKADSKTQGSDCPSRRRSPGSYAFSGHENLEKVMLWTEQGKADDNTNSKGNGFL